MFFKNAFFLPSVYLAQLSYVTLPHPAESLFMLPASSCLPDWNHTLSHVLLSGLFKQLIDLKFSGKQRPDLVHT